MSPASRLAAQLLGRLAGRAERWLPGLQEQSGMTNLAWLPGRLDGRPGHHCSRLAVLRLGSLGSGARAGGPGSKGLARAKSCSLPTATGWGLTWLAAG